MKKGNGYDRITLVSKNEIPFFVSIWQKRKNRYNNGTERGTIWKKNHWKKYIL